MSRVWSSCNIRTFNLHISVVFLLALNHFVSVSGVVLNLASSDIAVWKESYTFQCSASPTSEIGNLVGFQKLGSICLLQPTCQLISNLPGYSCGCAGVIGTTTIYNLTISSVKFTDEYNWTCTHGTSDISDGFQVLVHSPVYNVSIEISGSMNDSVNITEGESVVFTCVIHGAKPAPTSSQVMWYIEVPPDNNKTLQGISGNPIPSDKTTSINLTYTAGTQDQGQKVFCAATNSLMVNRSVPAVVSSNKIQLNIQSSPATTSNSATTSTIPSQSPTTTTKPTPTDWLFYVYIAAGVVGAVVFGIIVICCCRCHKVCCFKNSNESHDSPEDNKSQPYTNNVYAVVKKHDKERPESDVSYKSTCGFVDIDLNPSNPPTALKSGLPESDPSQPVSQAPRGNPLHDDIDLPSYKSSSRGPYNKSDDNKYTFYTGQEGTSDRPGEKAYDRLHVGERGYEGSGERGYEMLGEGGKVPGWEYVNVKKSDEGLARL